MKKKMIILMSIGVITVFGFWFFDKGTEQGFNIGKETGEIVEFIEKSEVNVAINNNKYQTLLNASNVANSSNIPLDEETLNIQIIDVMDDVPSESSVDTIQNRINGSEYYKFAL